MSALIGLEMNTMNLTAQSCEVKTGDKSNLFCAVCKTVADRCCYTEFVL